MTLEHRVKEVLKDIPEGHGFFLPDLYRELGIVSLGGSTRERVEDILADNGWDTDLLWDAERNTIARFAEKRKEKKGE
jgi:hypothetical protein